MALSDSATVFVWWIMLSAIGVIFLPLTTLLFSSFFDRGWAFAKIFGLLLLSYTAWLLPSLHLAPFSGLTIFILLGAFIILASILSYRQQTFHKLKGHWKVIFSEEALFTLGFLFWAAVRAFGPAIHGLEKFMDFGFINSILRSDYFPPRDLWMTPFPINYYYFGHLTVAVLTKLSGITVALTYNLFLAALFGLTLSASFSLGANLFHFFALHSSPRTTSYKLQTTFSGLLAAFLVTLGGNLHTIYAFFQNYPADSPLPFWKLLPAWNLAGYWYPNATRFIPFTIHEFPLYSFVVADLHGHVLNIPFVLLTIALLIKIFFDHKLQTMNYLLLSLLIATSFMTNVLDGPIYLLVIFLVLLAKKFAPIKNILVIALGAIIFSLPFWISFKPFGSGIGVLCAPQFLLNLGHFGPFLFEPNHCARSPLWMLFILWGFFYLVVFGFLIKLLRSPRKLKLLNSTDLLALVLTLASTLLILIPEFFYIKDIYPAHYRANTVFKFGYQAFIILGLVSGYMLTRLISSLKSQISKTFGFSLVFLPFAFLLFTLVAIYPLFAVNSYYGSLKTYQGLNGLNYLNGLYPADYQAILWLQENVPGQPVILEAQGDSYTDFARVSSNTGLPTVIGWPVHEWLWRGSYDEVGKRSADVTLLYESPDFNLTRQLAQKYHISYVFIGTLERQKYQNLQEAKLDSLGKVIFQSGSTRIYLLH